MMGTSIVIKIHYSPIERYHYFKFIILSITLSGTAPVPPSIYFIFELFTYSFKKYLISVSFRFIFLSTRTIREFIFAAKIDPARAF